MTEIVLAPFSNSDIRDWPAGHYARLTGILLGRLPQATIRLIGTKTQYVRACEIVREFDAARVINDCGRRPWPEVMASLRAASCVVGNNSGIAHLAGHYRVPTVCVFSGSHQRLEWRPLGPTVTTITRVIGCSPCHLDHGEACPYDKSCLRQIEPEVVADAVEAAMARGRLDAPPSANDEGSVPVLMGQNG